MKIYTRRGDTGETGLLGGVRVSKDHARVEAYGTVDELGAALGRALVEVRDATVRSALETVQHDLFTLGSALASVPRSSEGPAPGRPPALPGGRIAEMEAWMDGADAELPPLKAFVLAGGAPAAASLHVARTVCRRAERRVVALRALGEDVDDDVLAYLNRLSDLLFVFARLENHRAGVADVEWRK